MDLERDYPAIYRDDAALAAYVRLLAVAEKMWPVVPELPRATKPAPLARLVSASLVVRLEDYGYSIKGMAAERTRRTDSARTAAQARWSNAGGNAPAHQNGNAPRNADGIADAMPKRTEPNRTERAQAHERFDPSRVVDPQKQTPEEAHAAVVAAHEKRFGKPT